jgi:hypothetical protein
MTQRKTGADDGAPGAALSAALTRLVTDGVLTTRQAKAVTREVRAQLRAREASTTGGAPAGGTPAGAAPVGRSLTDADAERSPLTLLLAEIGGYVGGMFVLGAAAILLGDNWHGLTTTVRFAVLAAPALIMIAAAVTTARSTPGGWAPHPIGEPPSGVAPRRRLFALSTTVAAVLAGGAGAVLVDARGASGDWAAFAFSWIALAVAGVAYAFCRSELLHTALGLGVAASAVASLRVTGWYGERSTGWTFVALGAAWGAATLRGVLAERGLGFGWGGVLVFVGAELLVTADPKVLGYLVLTLLMATGLAGFARGRSLTLLVIGVATLAVLVPQAVIDATNGALGASGALLMVGLSIVGASALGFRLHRSPSPRARKG